eukprot:6191379-Pleurochrysis_carterae.AAC.2
MKREKSLHATRLHAPRASQTRLRSSHARLLASPAQRRARPARTVNWTGASQGENRSAGPVHLCPANFLSLDFAYSKPWKPKSHFAQHFPVDILGPPVLYWEMKFEMRRQALKNYAKRPNFVNVAYTVLEQADLKEALDLAEGKLLDFLKPELIDTVGERCLPGTSSIIDELYDAGAIPGGQSVWVRWVYGVKLTHRRTLTRASWLL